MIYSVFAGLGSTYLSKVDDSFIDLESSDYQWIWNDNAPHNNEERKGLEDKVSHPEWPENYIRAIEHARDTLNAKVLISAQPEVLELLKKYDLRYITVAPSKELKETYIKRYTQRGNNPTFITLMEENFNNFTEDMNNNNEAIANIVIRNKDIYLSHVLSNDRSNKTKESNTKTVKEVTT